MQKPVRDAVILTIVFLIGTGLLIAWIHSERLLSTGPDWQQDNAWSELTLLGLIEIAFLGLNLRAIKRGEFRWDREGVVTAIILIICGLMILPTLFVARMEAASSRAAHIAFAPGRPTDLALESASSRAMSPPCRPLA